MDKMDGHDMMRRKVLKAAYLVPLLYVLLLSAESSNSFGLTSTTILPLEDEDSLSKLVIVLLESSFLLKGGGV